MQNLYLVLNWSTFGSNYSSKSSWIQREKALHTWLWGFFWHSSLQIFSSSVRLDVGRQCSMKCWIVFKSGFWLGHSRTFMELSLKPLLRVIVLLEGEPSAQSEVPSALDQVYVKDISILCSVQLRQSRPVPATEKHPMSCCCHHHTSLLGWYWSGFLQTWCLECSKPVNLVSHSLSVF